MEEEGLDSKKAAERNAKVKRKNPLGEFISGNFLTQDKVVSHLPFLLFLCLMALIYIANGYLAEDTVRQLNITEKEVKELRSEYITTKSDLMHKSKQSEVVKIVESKGMGLKESYEPPKKIIVANNN